MNAWRTRVKLLVLIFPVLLAPYLLPARSKPPVLMSGLGQHHHVISTKSSEAQRFFDQGLTLVFAFNHEEAARAFPASGRAGSAIADAVLGHRIGVRSMHQS